MPLSWSQQLEHRLAHEVRGPGGERRAMGLAVTHEDEARVVGDLAPRVEVERERVGELEACEQGRVLRREVLA